MHDGPSPGRGGSPAGGQWRRLCCLLVGLVLPALPLSGENPEDPDEALLSAHGIRPDGPGIVAFLESLRPTEQVRKQVDQLIRRLGSPDWRTREQATQELIRLGDIAAEAVERATQDPDPEVRARAEHIRASGSSQGLMLVHAALRTLQRTKPPGAAEAVLGVIEWHPTPSARTAASEVLAAIATARDTDLLRRAIRTGAPEVRAAAAKAIGRALGREAAGELDRLLEDASEPVRLSAARALAELGERKCLEALTGLLESQDVTVRAEAGGILAALTRREFGFVAYDQAEVRAKAVAAWKEWLRDEGRTAALRLPLVLQPRDLGRTLVCDYANNKVVEYDLAGKVTFEASIAQPWGCAGLPNGHRVVASHGGQMIIEYDAAGKEFWRKEGLPAGPQGVEVQPDGNLLIACRDGGKVLEVNRAGKTVWEVNLGSATDAHCLPDGRILVAQQSGQVVEIDRAGKVLWTLKIGKGITTAQRLPSGNTLVAVNGAGGRVVEYDRDGKEVRSIAAEGANSGQRLPDGQTLVSDGKVVRYVDPAGKTLWEKPFGGCGEALRY